MEAKKNPKADLRKKSALFLNIGFVISLLIVISAFNYKSKETGKVMDLGQVNDQFDTTIEIPPTEQLPPPPPKVRAPKIIEVPDSKEIKKEAPIDLNIEANEETKISPQVVQKEPEPEEQAEQIFTIVEDQPSPVGGMAAFYEYVSKNLHYPAQARRVDVEGKVYVQFVVDKDGSITDPKVLKGIGSGCDKEAIRVLKNAPKWNPGKQRGRPVKVRMVIPIVFKLD